MRAFLCSYNGFTLAVPIDYVSSIMIYSKDHGNLIEYNDEKNNTFICLPLIFKNSQENVRHGIILKNIIDYNDDQDAVLENRFILLTTEIECETEILKDDVYPLPKTFNLFQFSFLFNGMAFSNIKDAENLILLLNPELLVQKIGEIK